MKTSRAVRAWAREEFGMAKLGDSRRTERLVGMSGQVAMTPSGRITEVFLEPASREASYRFIENEGVDAVGVVAAAVSACVARAAETYVVVPVDQTALSLPSAQNDEAFGPVGTRQKPSRGMEAMSAIAVGRDGTLLGVAGQVLFNRRPVMDKRNRQKRAFDEKETKYWLDVMNSSAEAFQKVGVRPWYQLDRGGDFKEALQWAADRENAWVTIRARHNRIAEGATEGKLWDVVTKTASLGKYELEVPRRPGRKARIARMQVRASPVYLRLRDNWAKTTGPVITFAIHAVEISKLPRGEKPIEWMLLVNRSIETLDDAKEVILNYAQRWKIEEVHRVWKTTCKVERSNLRSPESFSTWASVLFCVAVRIERLKRLARTTPHLDANIELSALEIRTLLLLKDRSGYEKVSLIRFGGHLG